MAKFLLANHACKWDCFNICPTETSTKLPTDPYEQFTSHQAEREEIWKEGYRIKKVVKKDDQAGSTPSPKLKVPIKEHENSDCASSTEEQLRLKISELKRNSFVGENLTKVSIQSWYLSSIDVIYAVYGDMFRRFEKISSNNDAKNK